MLGSRGNVGIGVGKCVEMWEGVWVDCEEVYWGVGEGEERHVGGVKKCGGRCGGVGVGGVGVERVGVGEVGVKRVGVGEVGVKRVGVEGWGGEGWSWDRVSYDWGSWGRGVGVLGIGVSRIGIMKVGVGGGIKKVGNSINSPDPNSSDNPS